MLELPHTTSTDVVLGFAGDAYDTVVYLTRSARALGVDVEVRCLYGLGDDVHSDLMRASWHREGMTMTGQRSPDKFEEPSKATSRLCVGISRRCARRR